MNAAGQATGVTVALTREEARALAPQITVARVIVAGRIARAEGDGSTWAKGRSSYGALRDLETRLREALGGREVEAEVMDNLERVNATLGSPAGSPAGDEAWDRVRRSVCWHEQIACSRLCRCYRDAAHAGPHRCTCGEEWETVSEAAPATELPEREPGEASAC